ncbi:MAG TPA: manganese efflux pump [Candidatus Dormibacteraeota bacterium]|nr:manganese efflux pump [Candidatus Dormibacteraeota bacterium]
MFDLGTTVKILAVAAAIGLDVLAVATGIGIAGVPWRARVRIGIAFSLAEISMQVIGVLLGSGLGKVAGEVAAYLGFAVLAVLGILMVRESFTERESKAFRTDTGAGLLVASLSISLDSLGVGFSMPSLHLPIVEMLVVVAFSTVVFTLAGLAFGARLGAHFEEGAERAAGVVLVVLAVLFAVQHIYGGH